MSIQAFADVQALVFDVFVDWRSGVAREATPSWLAREDLGS
jgi:hypothetical protein